MLWPKVPPEGLGSRDLHDASHGPQVGLVSVTLSTEHFGCDVVGRSADGPVIVSGSGRMKREEVNNSVNNSIPSGRDINQ